MKFFSSFAATAFVSILTMFPALSLAQKLESGTAAARTTPEYAKKVAQTFCDFLKSGISPETALSQAESEVSNSAQKPRPFNESIYRATLEKAVNEKGFCPEVPEKKLAEIRKPTTCNLSPKEAADLVISRSITKQGMYCLLHIKAH